VGGVVVGCGVAMGLGSSPLMGGERLRDYEDKTGEEFQKRNWTISLLESSP